MPITVFGSVPNLVITRKDLPVNSVKELIAYAKANSGKLIYGSQGSGNTPHLTANMFMNMTGTNMVHVPYRGETLVFNDMLGGRVDVFFGNISGALALYRDGRIKVLAVADKSRAAAIPEVPTTAEAGLPGLVSTAWYAMVAPPGMKAELQNQIAAATIEVLKMPDVQQRFRAINVEPKGMSPADMAAYVKEDSQRWGEVMGLENLDVVVTPPRSRDPQALYRLFGQVIGFDPDELSWPERDVNASWGYVEAEVYRRVNVALGDRLPHYERAYQPTVRWPFVKGVLPRSASARIPLPPEHLPWVSEVAEQQAAWLRDNVRVHGDLADLVPGPDSAVPLPEISEADVAAAAVETLANYAVQTFRQLRRPQG